MVATHQFTRVDTAELRDSVYRKIGPQRAEKYFDHLKNFLGLKLSKAHFDKCCIQTIGRENISLHNLLIQSILQNACQAKVPPQKFRKVDELGVKVANGYRRNCMQSLYGDAFPQSPRKCRSPINRDRKFRDRPSPLGPLGKSPSVTYEETTTIQEHTNAMDLHSLNGKPLVEVALVEDGEEVEQFAGSPSFPRWSHVSAPFGVSVSMNTSRKAHGHSFKNRTFTQTCESSGELPDTRSLRSCLQEKLATEGVGIPLDCANLLNNSLDIFLKRLIEPCLHIAGSQSNGQMISGLNGILLQRFSHGPLPSKSARMLELPSKSVRMLDFRVAMESNPLILGEDWSTQLEKICSYALEE